MASSIPGRLRLRAAPGQPAAWAAELTRRAEAMPGIQSVECNALTGSLLLEYEANEHTTESLIDELGVSLERKSGPHRATAQRTRSGRPILGDPVVMIGSLGLTVGALAIGLPHLHLWSGVVFVAGATEHAYRHREALQDRLRGGRDSPEGRGQ